MRSNQKNNRSRGRSGNNRNKNANPLTRSYDSNGPDVRVRGNASTVADKYVQLARDAQSAGDSVAAENYLQHAEHYFRIISAAQAQQLAQQQAQQQAQAVRVENQENRQDSRQDKRPDNRDNKPVEAGPRKEASGEDVAEKATQANDKAPDNTVSGGEDKSVEPHSKRERRPRRKPVSQKTDDNKSASGDPANAPQPNVSELPDFVTADSDSSAAE